MGRGVKEASWGEHEEHWEERLEKEPGKIAKKTAGQEVGGEGESREVCSISK
jgi:hypothetical protein